jgi:O-antigen/teichoic acid export membrane protein
VIGVAGFSSRFVLTAANILFVASNYIIHLIVARKVSVEAYGDYTLLILVMTTMSVILSSGAPTMLATTIRLAHFNERLKSLAALHLTIVGILFLFLLAGNIWLPLLVQAEGLKENWHLLVLLVIPFGLYSFMSSWFNLSGLYFVSALAVFVFMVTRLISTYLFLPFFGAHAIILGFSLGAVLASIPLIFLYWTNLRAMFNIAALPLERAVVRNLLSFLIFGLLVNLVFGWDLLVLSRIGLEREAFGEYATFATLAKVPLYIAAASLGFVWPELNARNGKERLKFALVLVAINMVITLIWGFFIWTSYTAVAELMLSRKVSFDNRIIPGYFIYILLLSSMIFIWQYMNTFMNRLLTSASVLLILMIVLLFELQSVMDVLSILCMSVVLSAAISAIFVWSYRKNAGL